MFKTLTEIFFGKREAYDIDEDPLANPDMDETKDLPLHVRQCGRRYGVLNKRLYNMEGRFDITNRLILFIIVVLLVNGLIDIKSIIQNIFAWSS